MAENQRSIIWHPKINRICQISSKGLEYAFVSDDYCQVHQLVSCRDFLQDVIHSHIHQHPTSIYDFRHDPANSPMLSTKQTKLMVTHWKDPNLEEKIKLRSLPLIHRVEKQLGMPLSKLEKCGNVPRIYGRSGVWLFNSSKRWSNSPPMISMFSLLIRIGLVADPDQSLETLMDDIATGRKKGYFGHIPAAHPEDPDEEQDQTQVIKSKIGIKHILKYGDKKLFGSNRIKNYPALTEYGVEPEVDMFVIHDHCGISSFSKRKNEKIFPHWYKIKFDKDVT